jgi:hypothetical protein
VAAVLLLAVAPATAQAPDSQDDSLSAQFERLASKLKTESARALAAASGAASRALAQSQIAIAEAETELGPQLETFRTLLNEQKAKLAKVGEDAVAQFEAWKQAAAKTWSETWTDSLGDSWAEIQRSTMEAIDRFRAWLDDQPPSDEQTETPV